MSDAKVKMKLFSVSCLTSVLLAVGTLNEKPAKGDVLDLETNLKPDGIAVTVSVGGLKIKTFKKGASGQIPTTDGAQQQQGASQPQQASQPDGGNAKPVAANGQPQASPNNQPQASPNGQAQAASNAAPNTGPASTAGPGQQTAASGPNVSADPISSGAQAPGTQAAPLAGKQQGSPGTQSPSSADKQSKGVQAMSLGLIKSALAYVSNILS